MSVIAYISFPKELKAFRISDIEGKEKECGINYDINNLRKDIFLFPSVSPWESDFIIVDKKNAVFGKCFNNLFIYELCESMSKEQSREYYQQKQKILRSDKNDEVKEREMDEFSQKWWLIRNQSFHDFINTNLDIGGFVEIYTTWHDHVNFNFSSPTSEESMNLEDVLSMPLPKKSIGFDTVHKLTIYKTK